MNDLTQEDINVLRKYLNTESGKKLLLKLVEQETALLAHAFSAGTTMEQQNQNINRAAGIYWTRNLIQSLIDKK